MRTGLRLNVHVVVGRDEARISLAHRRAAHVVGADLLPVAPCLRLGVLADLLDVLLHMKLIGLLSHVIPSALLRRTHP